MNVVVFAPYAIATPHFETDLEIIQDHLERGDQVTLLECRGELPVCDSNPYHDRPRCWKCISRRQAGLALLSGPVRVESFAQLTEADRREQLRLRTEFRDGDDLKSYTVGEFDLGYAVLSSLVSIFRDPEIDLTRHAALVAGFVHAGWLAYRSLGNYLDQHPVDRVYLFNGRFAPLRGALRACQERGVHCVTHERGRDLDHYAVYHNTTPHDRDYIVRQIHSAWEAATDDPRRETLARRWFEDRAVGRVVGRASFTRHQQAQLLPAGWDPARRNVAVFVSSEDEFVAIGKAWQNPLYASQVAALRAVLASLEQQPDPVHLYLRMHPNLARLDNHQTRELNALRSPMMTRIEPLEPVDTYALMRQANQVLTFGSTTGIEAVYWGTPSILAGPAFYESLGGTYNARSHEHLVQLICRELEPLDPVAALKYAYYRATEGQPYHHYQGQGIYRGRFKGRHLRPRPVDQARILMLQAVWPARLLRRLGHRLQKSA